MNLFQRLIARAKGYKPFKKLFMIGALICGGLVFLLIATLWPPSAPVGTQNTAKQNEHPPQISVKEKKGELRISKNGAHGTVMKTDKGLVFGGRGFEVIAFASKSKLPLGAAYTRHMQREPPRMVITVKENLDLTQKEIKSAKPLIFHSRPAGFFKTAKRMENETDKKPARAPPFKPESIPETKLLLSQGGESILLLDPAKNSIDLLENEDLSFNRYHQMR